MTPTQNRWRSRSELNRTERLILGSRLIVSLGALCLVVLAGGMHLFLPAERGIADLVAGASVGATGLRALAGSLGAVSNHPLSRAAAATVPASERVELQETRELGGFGVTGEFDGQVVAMGRADLFTRLGIEVPAAQTSAG